MDIQTIALFICTFCVIFLITHVVINVLNPKILKRKAAKKRNEEALKRLSKIAERRAILEATASSLIEQPRVESVQKKKSSKLKKPSPQRRVSFSNSFIDEEDLVNRECPNSQHYEDTAQSQSCANSQD